MTRPRWTSSNRFARNAPRVDLGLARCVRRDISTAAALLREEASQDAMQLQLSVGLDYP